MLTFKECKFIVDNEGNKRRLKGLSRILYWWTSGDDPITKIINLWCGSILSLRLASLHLMTAIRGKLYPSPKAVKAAIVVTNS